MYALNRLAGVVAVAAVTLSTLGVAAPAQAAPGDATLSFAPTAVLNEGSCIDHAFTYNVEVPAGTTSWSMRIEMIGPDNANHASQLVGTFAGDPTSGTEALQLCSLFEPIGTYTLYSTVDYKVGTAPTVWGPRNLEGTFQAVRDAKSKVTLKANHKAGKVVSVAKVSVSTGGDYGPVAEGGKVTFQKKVGRKWKKVETALTNASGVAKGTFKAARGTLVRAVFAGAGEVLVGSGMPVPPATSKAVRAR